MVRVSGEKKQREKSSRDRVWIDEEKKLRAFSKKRVNLVVVRPDFFIFNDGMAITPRSGDLVLKESLRLLQSHLS